MAVTDLPSSDSMVCSVDTPHRFAHTFPHPTAMLASKNPTGSDPLSSSLPSDQHNGHHDIPSKSNPCNSLQEGTAAFYPILYSTIYSGVLWTPDVHQCFSKFHSFSHPFYVLFPILGTFSTPGVPLMLTHIPVFPIWAKYQPTHSTFPVYELCHNQILLKSLTIMLVISKD